MKLLKVKIKRNQSGGKTSYVYPPEYDAKKFTVLVYESQLTGGYYKVVNRADGQGHKNNHEYVIGMVEDVYATSFLASSDIIEVNKAEVDEFLGVDLDKKVEKITDQNAVLSVLSKIARKETLSTEDEKIIDPLDSTPGIIHSKSFNDVLKERGF